MRAALERSGKDHGPIGVFEKMKSMGLETGALGRVASQDLPSERCREAGAAEEARAAYRRFVYRAPNELPWLVLDDPVQSMDDIHTANFTTAVRQLSYLHGRHVVIAVHQRELFEYLALKLAPAVAGELLLKISLDRLGGTTVIQSERVQYSQEQKFALASVHSRYSCATERAYSQTCMRISAQGNTQEFSPPRCASASLG